MISINLVTLPRTCFAAVPLDYPCEENTLKIEKFYTGFENMHLSHFRETVNNVEEIVKNKDASLYVNLDVRKYLQVDAQLKSGKVQGKSCDYYIHTRQDNELICVMTVGDLINGLQIDDYIRDHENYNTAKELLENAIDFEIIEPTDYVRMTYTNPNRNTWRNSNHVWNAYANHHRVNVMSVKGMVYPANKKIIPLIEVLEHSYNNSITEEQANKIKRLLDGADTEKLAITIMNGINPNKSFIELLCLINHMSSDISRRLSNTPVLPLMYGAYGCDTKMVRRSDTVIREYKKYFGEPTKEVLERLIDSYYHPKNEQSSVFDFKLKFKKHGV
jgi:hypothetical protein